MYVIFVAKVVFVMYFMYYKDVIQLDIYNGPKNQF